MVSHCRGCQTLEGEPEAVGCVTIVGPVTGVTLLLAYFAPVAKARWIQDGWIEPHWIWDVLATVAPLALALPVAWVVWELPVRCERLRNLWRRCRLCGDRDWQIGDRGFGV